MGWWWSSSSSASSSAQSKASDVAVSTIITQSDAPPPFSKPVSPEEQADREIESFLAGLESNSASTTPAFSRTIKREGTTPAPQETLTHYAPSGTTDPSARVDLETLDISPKSLYPRTMSCRQAFDQAFYCQSMGGKFNDLYRYGGIRSCSEQWGAFWFCMRVKGLPDKEKEHAIAEWYETREDRIKTERGGSSEDVWELRTEPVKKAFWKDPDEVTQSWKGESDTAA